MPGIEAACLLLLIQQVVAHFNHTFEIAHKIIGCIQTQAVDYSFSRGKAEWQVTQLTPYWRANMGAACAAIEDNTPINRAASIESGASNRMIFCLIIYC